MFFCRHCRGIIPTLDDIKHYACFEGKEVFLEGEKELYSPEMNDNEKNMNKKMNALTKQYKECIDSNNKTGRDAVEFQWFDQFDEIFGKNKKKQC
ncbi:hypothetical protein P5V15_010155 [Pogonomyrmex californicus]